MEESITMTEILAKIIRSWKKVCLIALIVAALLGAFQAYRMISQARSPENTPAAIGRQAGVCRKQSAHGSQSL